MLNEVVTYNASQMSDLLYPLIEPLSEFERIVKDIDTQKKKKPSVEFKVFVTKLPMILGFPAVCWILYTILNIRALLSGMSYIFLVQALSFFIPVGIFVMYFMPIISKEKNRQIQGIDEKISDLEYRRNELANELYGPLTAYVPPDYQYSYAISSMYEYFVNMRARNITEAINLYEDELHKKKMESMQAQILHEQRVQSAMATVSAVANISTAFSAAHAASSLDSINSKL